ncbi:MAG: peptide deformylase [Spirochaetales bacterium]|nr:MAG: peptide deformylase [Spirochaetales bacterium]
MLNILTYGAPELSQKAESVKYINGDIPVLVEQMFDAMHAGKGIGLAAPQVGSLIRLFVCHAADEEPMVFINPEILETSLEEISYEEGCLSLPGLYGDIIRPRLITVQAVGLGGKPFTLRADGIMSRVIHHEMDHLDGILFPDRLPPNRKERLFSIYEKKLRI